MGREGEYNSEADSDDFLPGAGMLSLWVLSFTPSYRLSPSVPRRAWDHLELELRQRGLGGQQ